MSGCRQQIREALEAITIHSRAGYSWFSRSSTYLPAWLRSRLTDGEIRNYLLYDLSSRLYGSFYIHGAAISHARDDDRPIQAGVTPFVANLSAANSGAGCLEDGWAVHVVESDVIGIVRGNLEVWVHPHDSSLGKENSLAPGTTVRLRLPKEFLAMSPGFYMALGDKAPSLNTERPLIRLYWNLRAEGAALFVRIASQLLNEAGVPFRLKILRDPILFTRCDAAVVYLFKRDYHASEAIFQKIYAAVGEHLKPSTPVFTKPIALGVGLAEDPGLGESFGQNRCRLLAEAAIRAHEEGQKTMDARLKIVSDRFAEIGIDLGAPFLSAGSTDDYGPFSLGTKAPRTAVKAPGGGSDSESFLGIADELGRRLVRDAVWHGDQCNWLGAESTGRSADSGGARLTYAALGPDLYSGTSGVALFLAELYAAAPASEARRTALGAMQHAIGHYDARVEKSRLGFYTGGLGIVFAAARVGTLLGDEELLMRAARLLRECVQECPDNREYDLLSGDAGAIVALLILRQLSTDEPLLDLALKLGDRLLLEAHQSPRGSSWKSINQRYRYNLTGFSHGAAGIGYALLELYQATGDVNYLAGAEGGFAYERSWFNAEKGNWPDFREGGVRNGRRFRPLAYSTFWCHGAPGIGLSRLRACEILKDDVRKNEANTATSTTYAMLKAAIPAANVNFSLCHGLAGNAETLLSARQVLGQEWVDKSRLALEVAGAGIELSKRQGGAWACGVEHGETPSLLLGLAGIGYFYLRLHDPAVPSILMPRPEDFSRRALRLDNRKR